MPRRKFIYFLICIFSLLLSGVIFSAPAFAYLDVSSNSSLTPGEVLYISGNLTGEPNVNITATLTNATGSVTNSTNTSTDGSFNITIYTGNVSEGMRIVTVSVNASLSKSTDVYMTSVKSTTLEFVETPQPVTPGNTIKLKVTAYNSSALPALNKSINGTIYAADGLKMTVWGEVNARTNNDGVAYLNFTIPNSVIAGKYLIDVEYGRGVIFFIIKKFTLNVKTKDSDGIAKAKFTPGGVVTVDSKITNSSGDAFNVDGGVVCDITDGNGTTSTITATRYGTGAYQCNYTTTSSVAQSYNVKVTANDTSGTEKGYTGFSTQDFSVSLSPRTGMEFFHEFGGEKSFTIGQKIAMDIIAVNISSGNMLERDVNYDYRNITIVDVWYAQNGTSVNSSATNAAVLNGTYMTTPNCYYEFKLGQLTGEFGIKINLTVGRTTVTGQGYFSVNKYLLKASPATIFGGMDDFVLLKPGYNASFKLSLFNLTSNEELGYGNITNAVVTKIVPLTFGSSGSGATEYSMENINYSYFNGTSEDPPYLNVQIPDVSGPQILSVRATLVSRENVTATSFYMAKYIMGFVMPSGTTFGEGGGGEGDGPPTGGTIACTAGTTSEFSGLTMDANTMQPAKGVIFNSIKQAMEEMTGEDFSSCFTSTVGISDSNGRARLNITFGSGCSFSGFYSIIFNVTYKDKTDDVPAFFECKQLNFWAYSDPWNAQPDTTITVIMNNASYAGNSSRVITSGNVSLSRLFNFNPSSGGQKLTANVNLNSSIRLISSNYFNGNISISPQNFSVGSANLTTWPGGFYDGKLQVCDGATGGACDTGFFGFDILSFRAYTTWWDTAGTRTYSAGDVVATTVYAQTKMSRGIANITLQNETTGYSDGFDAEIRNPMSQEKYTVTKFNVTNATLDADMTRDYQCGGSCSMANRSWQKFNISFEVPSTVTKGSYMGLITLNNTNNTQVDLFVDFAVRTYTVGLPYQEKMEQSGSGGTCCGVTSFNCSITDMYNNGGYWCSGCYLSGELQQRTRWNASNWTYVANAFGIVSGGDGDVCAYPYFNLSASGGNFGSASPTNNAQYAVLAYKNSTHKMFFLRNNSNMSTIFKLNETNLVPDTKQYLWSIEGPWFVLFANATNTTLQSDGGLVQEEWGWAGQYEYNKNFSIPFMVIRNNRPATSGMGVTVKNLAKIKTEGFGLEGMLDPNYYTVFDVSGSGDTETSNNDYVGVDSNGLGFVKMNVSRAGKFKLFWRINSTAKDTGSFDKSPVVDVKKFYAYTDWATFLPQQSKQISLGKNVTATFGANCNVITLSAFYNGTFSESPGNEFIVDGSYDRYYFLLANESGGYRKIYIENGSTPNCQMSQSINLGSGEWGNSLWGSNTYVADRLLNNTDNTSTIIFYSRESIGGDRFSKTVNSPTEEIGVKVCAMDLGYKPINATINMNYINWIGMMGPPSTKNITLYNLTTNQPVYQLNISSLANNGCIATKVRPENDTLSGWQAGYWEQGESEIKGTATGFDNFAGDQEEFWVGPISYWPTRTI